MIVLKCSLLSETLHTELMKTNPCKLRESCRSLLTQIQKYQSISPFGKSKSLWVGPLTIDRKRPWCQLLDYSSFTLKSEKFNNNKNVRSPPHKHKHKQTGLN